VILDKDSFYLEGAYCGRLSAGLISGMLAAESIVAASAISR
jgi:hypothetical protein